MPKDILKRMYANMEAECLILGPTLTSCVSTILTLFTYALVFDFCQ